MQLGRSDVDITDRPAVDATLAAHSPRAVVNCAVYQPVDLCESEPHAAFAVNATGAGLLARACQRAGARLVHLSTDYVFGGELRRPYREDDLPGPLNVYAASKLAGEHLVLAASEMHMVVRTSGVFGTARRGHGRPPFIQVMLERARAGLETQVVNDQVVSPTHAEDLARGIWGLLGCGGTGVFHVANRGAISWFDVAALAFEAAGARHLLRPTTAHEFGAPAKRPAFSALDNARLRGLGLDDLPRCSAGLERYLAADRARGSTTP